MALYVSIDGLVWGAGKEEASSHIDAVGKFVLRCMEDVQEKVVELHDEASDEQDAMVTVMPGALRYCKPRCISFLFIEMTPF